MIENGIEIRIETSMEMNENDKPDGRLPIFDYSTADQVDQMQQEANANDRFSQNVYINLNSVCDFHAFTKLIAFLLFIFFWNYGFSAEINYFDLRVLED